MPLHAPGLTALGATLDIMAETPRALRRAHDRRVKARTRRIMRLWLRGLFKDNPRKLGVNASTRCRPCGCFMCQEDRRDVPTLRERRFTDTIGPLPEPDIPEPGFRRVVLQTDRALP